MKTTDQGRAAENAVAELLKQQDFKILDQNWRTRTCEIDVIAQKDKTIYFVEVKYRGELAQGDGFEYVTAAKQKQMLFAANNWIAENDYQGDYALMAAAVSGPDCQEIQILEI